MHKTVDKWVHKCIKDKNLQVQSFTFFGKIHFKI